MADIDNRICKRCLLKDYDPEKYLDKKEARRMDKYTQFAIIASREAFKDSGINTEDEDDIMIKNLEDDIEKNKKELENKNAASENEYNRRLDICKDCEKLSQGTCLRCGCYVELRAASKNAHCPGKSW